LEGIEGASAGRTGREAGRGGENYWYGGGEGKLLEVSR